MIMKTRSKPRELSVLEILDQRMTLSTKHRKSLLSLQKGGEGEAIFDSLMEGISEGFLLNDLRMIIQGKAVQIDSLLITAECVHLFEIKHYAGDYVYENERFYRMPKNEILNPLHQLERAHALLAQLISHLGFSIPIRPHLIFTHPQFMLYQAPTDSPIIFPQQLDSFMKQLHQPSTTPLTNRHKTIAERLLTCLLTDFPYTQLPDYNFSLLKKGISCVQCGNVAVRLIKRTCRCESCNATANSSAVIMKSVRELRLLFPEEKLTTSLVHEWCGDVIQPKRIRKILDDRFEKIGKNKGTYYSCNETT